MLANFQAKVICWKSWVSVTLGKCCAAQIPLCVTSVRSVRLFLVKIYHWFTIDFQQFVVQNPMFVLFPDSIPNLSCIQNPCLSIKIFSVNSSEFLILLDLFMPFFNEFPMNSAQIMVNLIPYNPTAASGGFQAPKHQRVERPFIARILWVDSCGHFKLGKWQFSQNYDDHWWSDFFESLM